MQFMINNTGATNNFTASCVLTRLSD
jgi:hypothetical protein